MHAVHLPPRHLWRSAVLAAVLTLAFMALLFTATAQRGSDSSSPAQTPQAQRAVPQAAPSAGQSVRVPDSSPLKPLAPPMLLELARAG